MNISPEQRLVVDPGEAFTARFEASPNSKPGLTPRQLVAYATQRKDVASQVAAFKTGPASAHLIISRDGREIVQMVDFNRSAAQNSPLDATSLAIKLDNPGPLLANVSENDFRSVRRYDPAQIITAPPVNGAKLRPWLLYAPAQLDAFLAVARLLLERFASLDALLANDEVAAGMVDPGPTFPRYLMREKLLAGRSLLDTLQETSQEVLLRQGPGSGHPAQHAQPLPAGTQVAVSIAQEGWVFVEALAELDGNAWPVGWVEERAVRTRVYTPVVVDNLLRTTDNRRYPFMPAGKGNFEPAPRMNPPRYIVIHGTTGTQLSSTINTFTKDGTGLSTHLVIGRDGRVVQFLPFDTIGHHAGLSFWEGQRSLNRMSIGIELDNAQYLRKENGQFFRKKTLITDVAEVPYWKETRIRGWEKFPPVQLETALAVVKALVECYHIEDILGHDIINLINRSDPGPLCPLDDWREQIYGRREPAFRVFTLTREVPIFENHLGAPPNDDHPKFPGTLPARSRVKVQDKQGVWALVKVLESSKGVFVNRAGWLLKGNLQKRADFSVTMAAQEMYQKLAGEDSPPPPTEAKGSPLPAGTRVRIQETRGGKTLVFVLDLPKKKMRWLEGWVETDALEPPP